VLRAGIQLTSLTGVGEEDVRCKRLGDFDGAIRRTAIDNEQFDIGTIG